MCCGNGEKKNGSSSYIFFSIEKGNKKIPLSHLNFSKMDDDTLTALLRSEDPEDLYHVDNEMLTAEAGGGRSSGGQKNAAPCFFVSAKQAVEILNGGECTENETEGWDSSCDELVVEEEEEEEELEEEELEEGRRRRRPRTRLCFGCSFSSSSSSTDSTIQASKINMMLRMHDDLYGRIDGRTLARMLHLYFMKEIREPLLEAGIEIPVWRSREIHEHFRNHQLDPRIMLGNQIQGYRSISEALDRLAFERTDGGSGVGLNKDNLALKLRVDQHILRLYSTDTTKMNFFNADVRIDFASVGARLNPLRGFSLE